MTHTLSASLNLIISISFAITATFWAYAMSGKTRRLLSETYHLEFEAHRCGRALAALENIRFAGQIMKKHKTANVSAVETATKHLERRIDLALHPASTIKSQTCQLLNSDITVASLYRYDRFNSQRKEFNFGYRLTSEFMEQ